MIYSVFTRVASLMDKLTLVSGSTGRCAKPFAFGDNDFLTLYEGYHFADSKYQSCQLEVVNDLKVLEVMLRKGSSGCFMRFPIK